ncbi:MAG: 50S ribosomal protein L19 [Verrucomicrobia bacterium]|jgi:large subunit ribosomal protein L19|nr:50S ribosomal protein L19 [Verrucomicrobiota bacterium]
MVSPIVESIGNESMKADVAEFAVGDSVRVHVKIKEGDKERIQVFAGIVIARDGGGGTETFTVRRISHGVGVERVFPIHSPYVEKIEVERSAHVRRAKLYYQRNRTGKKARLKEKITAKQ